MRKPKRKIVIPVLVVAGTLLLFRFVLFIGYVPTESMEPTLHKGSLIIGSRIFGELEVGDIVVFRHEGKLFVKRIAAVGGEKIARCGKNNIIPENHFYMLGDNEENSFDSRYWDDPFIDDKKICAKVWHNS